jgi:DNA mismatch endonuclease (patch repair protein)
MTDIVDRATRSRMMAGIRGRDTKPELEVRRALHKLGFRFRLHSTKLPGRPDLVFPKHQAVVFVHGCFWHGHDCRYFKAPSTRAAFWSTKIAGNRSRDERRARELHDSGWRVMVIWECAIRDRTSDERLAVMARLARWIKGKKERDEIA